MAVKAKGGVGVKIAAGVVAAGAAAAAAGYYFYASDKAKAHRKIAAKWAGDMKKKVVTQAKKVKDMDAKDFGKIVDTVARTYEGARSVSVADLKRATKELKANWKTVGSEIKKAGKKNVTTVKKVVKKVTKNS